MGECDRLGWVGVESVELVDLTFFNHLAFSFGLNVTNSNIFIY